MSKSAKKDKTPPARISGKTLQSHIKPVSKCEEMLARLAKSKGGLPAFALRENSRMVVINVAGKPMKINPVFVGQLFGLQHRLTPYAGEAYTAQQKNVGFKAAFKAGKVYHYRTLLLGLAKAGYTVKLSADCDDDYVVDSLKAAVKASKAANVVNGAVKASKEAKK